MKLAIVAGGKGTRLVLKDTPKPMAQIGGKPILEHQINVAKEYGINDIYILSGHLANSIEDYFGDGSSFGVNITHTTEKHPLGTAGAVKQLEDNIDERFMIFYGDVVFDIDLKSFIEFDKRLYSIATIIVHPNDHPYDSDLVEIDDENIVTAFHSKPHKENAYYRNLVNAGIYILSPEVFKYIPENKPTDFGKDIFPLVLRSKKIIRAYRTAEYIKDIGTVDRLKKVSADFISGRVGSWVKTNKRSGIFLDRDGTLIEDIDLLHRVDDLKLLPYADRAVKQINESDFLCFLITNQPVVARNLCDMPVIKQIHNKLETLLGKTGAYLNDIYFCPHHPDKGYPGENKEFKIECDCRKPKTGMIEKAVKEYNVDVESSWFIGDTTTDTQTGIIAGLQTILARTGKGGKDRKFHCIPDFVFDNLEEAVDFILEGRHKYNFYIEKVVDYIKKDKNRSPFIISIAGLARSGKSTFVKLLKQILQKNGVKIQVISLDNWLVGVDERTDHMTVRERYKYDEIENDMRRLLNQENILLKTYDAYSRSIASEESFSFNNSKCLIIDGVSALDISGLRNISGIKVYVDIDENVRKKRFFSFYKWKDLPEEQIEYLYFKRLSDEVPSIRESRKYADIILKL
jgi:histidinol-phosphate phosphatase family protein